MNKYFLPVYHSQLKPWIKWWILKRLNGGQSSLKAVTLSSGTLTKVDKTKALSIKEYYGNTVQNGTPTPESPVEIKTISGDNTFTINGVDYRLDLGGKNKFYYSSASDVNNTIVSTYRVYKIENLEPNTAYNINNIDINAPLEGKYIYLWSDTVYSSSQKYFIAAPSGYQTKVNFTSNAEGNIYLAIYPTDTNTWESVIPKFQYAQIEKGTEATPYSPYVANPIELCKIGDYKDKIVNVDGTWKVEKKVGKVILNGSETWGGGNSASVSTNYTYVYSTQYDNLIKKGYYVAFCDKMKNLDGIMSVNTQVTTDTIAIGDPGFSNRIRIMILTSRLPAQSTTGMKNWLSSNNVTVYYVLETPTTETITNTNLISQLNALYEFYVNSSKVTISNNSEIPLEVLLEYYGR